MCFYLSNTKTALELSNRYGRETAIAPALQPVCGERYKITAFSFPLCPVVTALQSIETARWGLIPAWIKTETEAQKIRRMTLNARCETVFDKPAFRASLQKRCLLPCTGYFEFHHEGKNKIPYFIFLKKEEIFSIGGLYEQWVNPNTKESLQTFTILTVQANELCTKIHNGGKNPFRMPLVIERKKEEIWLDNALKETEIKNFFNPFNSAEMDAFISLPPSLKLLAVPD